MTPGETPIHQLVNCQCMIIHFPIRIFFIEYIIAEMQRSWSNYPYASTFLFHGPAGSVQLSVLFGLLITNRKKKTRQNFLVIRLDAVPCPEMDVFQANREAKRSTGKKPWAANFASLQYSRSFRDDTTAFPINIGEIGVESCIHHHKSNETPFLRNFFSKS